MSELPWASSRDELYRRFAWRIPHRFNIARACVDRWADGRGRPALIARDSRGRRQVWSYDRLAESSRRLAQLFAAKGVGRGDRVAVLLPQRPETALAHLAAWRLGAITVPLFTRFGPEALSFRLRDSGARLVVTDALGAERLQPLRGELGELETLLSVEDAEGAESLWPLLARAQDRDPDVATGAEDPAVLLYTSGTTGPPKGALHAHRVLLGHLPGVQMPHEFFPQQGDRFFTPADWAWIGGLFDVLLPSLYFGVPVVVAPPGRFDPETVVRLMAEEEVRNLFLPPTAIRMMRQADVDPLRMGVRLRTLASGGEPLGGDVLEWGRARFGLTINEFYGQTEANLLVANMAGLLPVKEGSMGVAVPGHEVAVVDEEGVPVADGEVGVIAVRKPDPVMFLGYWRQEEASRAKFRGPWMCTGDLGRRDGEGYFTFLGREDDVITSAGYRIGPSEVEACLARHPAVGLCAVVGVPDELRGEVVKAFIVPKPGVRADEALAEDIRNFVRTRLAAHLYPRRIAFVPELPLTATGKVRRSELRARERGASGDPTT